MQTCCGMSSQALSAHRPISCLNRYIPYIVKLIDITGLRLCRLSVYCCCCRSCGCGWLSLLLLLTVTDADPCAPPNLTIFNLHTVKLRTHHPHQPTTTIITITHIWRVLSCEAYENSVLCSSCFSMLSMSKTKSRPTTT